MKRIILVSAAIVMAASLNLTAQTNDFYDDAPTNPLKSNGRILVGGEVENEIVIDFSTLVQRNVIVKETAINSENIGFTGAYRYEGFSLYDILDEVVLKKKNADEFPPIIDLYVEVSNDRGEKAVLSWGELYYPNNRHQIIIATAVARIVPSKTKDLWPLPEESKLIVGPDLITARNISNPTRITIRSLDCKYAITREMSPMYSKKIDLKVNGTVAGIITNLPKKSKLYTYNTVFYGRGRGIHGTTPFTGIMFLDILKGKYTLSQDALRHGLVVVAGLDGYRSAFTLSEIVNRNDQQELLLIDRRDEDGAGRFSLFPAADYFSDRAIKSVMEINLILP